MTPKGLPGRRQSDAPPPVRLGLIGAGRWGRAYISTIASVPGALLSRVASRKPETRALVGPSCAVSSDWRELVRAKDLDGVIIAAPPSLHAEMALAAIEAELPVLVEKPLTMDLGEAKAVLKTAQEREVLAMVDHIFLHHPAYRALKEKAKELGPPRAILSTGGNWGPFRLDVPPLWDYGPHDMALCLDFLGTSPVSGESSRQSALQPQGEGEIVTIRLKFPGKVTAELAVGNIMTEKHRSFRVYFEKRALFFDDLKDPKLVLHELGQDGRIVLPGEALPHAQDRPLNRVVQAFAGAIRSGSKDLSGLRLGVDVVEALAASQESLLGR